MDEIWGSECETGWETVTVHVGRLRKRFENWDEFDIVSVTGSHYFSILDVDVEVRISLMNGHYIITINMIYDDEYISLQFPNSLTS